MGLILDRSNGWNSDDMAGTLEEGELLLSGVVMGFFYRSGMEMASFGRA